MKPLAQIAFALVVMAIQAALLRWVGGGAWSMSLGAACVVYLGLNGGNVDGSLASAGVGYLLDVLGGGPRGLMTFLAVAVFLLARAAGAGVDVRGRAGFAVLSAMGALTFSIGGGVLLRYVAAPEAAPGPALLPRMLGEALLTGLASPLVLAGMRRLDGLFHREEPGLLH